MMYQDSQSEGLTSASPSPDPPSTPYPERSLTDTIFCILMIVFWGVCIFVTIYCLVLGDPNKIFQTYDIDSNPCGKNQSSGFPYAYFFNPIRNGTLAICVEKCPQWGSSQTPNLTINCYQGGSNFSQWVKTCTAESVFNFASPLDISEAMSSRDFLYYNTSTFIGRVCLPSVSDMTAQINGVFIQVSDAITSSEFFRESVSDIQNTRWYFLYIGAIAVFISTLLLLMLRFCGGIVIWFLLFALLVSVFGLAVLLGYEATRLTENPSESSQYLNLYSPTNLKAASITLYVIGGLGTLIVLFSLSSIAVSIAVIESCGQFIAENPMLIFVPLTSSIIGLAFICFWIVVFAFLWSIGDTVIDGESPLGQVQWSQSTGYLAAIHIVSLFWNSAFIHLKGGFILSSSAAIWYKAPSVFNFPLLKSLWWGFRYHLGSIALASLILAIVWIIQLAAAVLAYYVRKLKTSEVDSCIVGCFVKCLGCCLVCVERLVQFLCQNGLIQVAISSVSFCRGCFIAFGLIAENPMKFGSLKGIGTVVIVVGKLFVSASAGIIGYFLLKANTDLSEKLYSIGVPVALFVIEGFVVSELFFAVFGLVADTIVMCFLVDKEEAEKFGRPVVAPEPMLQFYEKYKKDK